MSRKLYRQLGVLTLVIGLSIQSMAMEKNCLCAESLPHSSCCSSDEGCCCCSEADGCCCCSEEDALNATFSECNCDHPKPQPLAPAAPDTRQIVELLLSIGDHNGVPEEIVPVVNIPSFQLENSTQKTLTAPQILLCIWQT